MFVPDELKLNKFKLVKIPTNKDYFARVGLQSAGTPDMYTGDEMANMGQSKMDSIIEADKEFRDQLNKS